MRAESAPEPSQILKVIRANRDLSHPLCGIRDEIKKQNQKRNSGGEGGIRTPGTLSVTAVFKTACFNRSHTSPRECVNSLSAVANHRPEQLICLSSAPAEIYGCTGGGRRATAPAEALHRPPA